MEKQADAIEAPGRSVLIAGASFAGLSTAFWMQRLGYDVTIVEIAKGLKRGGTPVDIRDRTVGIVERMGILDAIQAQSLPPRTTAFKNANDETEASLPPQSVVAGGALDEYEIERDALLDILFDAIEGKVEIRFDDTIASLEENEDGVWVGFADGTERTFSLVLGCDGSHSSVRKKVFGPEADYSHFLGIYFSISIVNRQIVEKDTTQIYSVPGKTVMLNSYDGKADIVLCFHSDVEIDYDYRDQGQQKQIILDRFTNLGWRTPTLMEEVKRSENFYFDKLCQVKMPSWTKGRVALVGDAAYCASPAAGMGGSLAIVGAAALAEAFARYGEDYAAAFEAYDQNLRPFIEEVQVEAVTFGLETFAPRTQEAISMRNAQLAAS
uniref:Monooxygenase FAD-binding n=1 Tax=Caulobacter sp. (strain K31) TaxID=366602 RepID=B0T7E5_CAUSK